MSHNNGFDEYRSWDAAYVLGSLVSSERHEFEQHMSGCAGCRAAVAELAGLPSLLAALSPEEAQALGRTDGESPVRALPPGLAKRAQRGRRRARLAVAGLVLGAAAASGVVAVAVTTPAPTAVQTQATSDVTLNFTPVVDSALVAKGSLTRQPWGTRIDWECTYKISPAESPSWAGPGGPRTPEEYGLVVIDSRGGTTQVATWTATPGTVAAPTATTNVPVADIRRVEIRAVAGGRTLLSASV
ncbi:zf-HC2 domain-containing protein [Arthrobacter sp. NicSoilB8]|uniref:anti-sigma factor family protein n=1 Tax=Arthrobacter sp. NicSoilB8 TaxID=2830998 RepID=UPI001CC5307D|nr:zf-HC2 domain-containing protein [Arthrobacter sp. NicSoilB8]BCW71070.1 anti-sigma factor [Arthrobacter sp. NicSoilB8]